MPARNAKLCRTMSFRVNRMVAEKDLVAVHFTVSGNEHTGRDGVSGNGQEDRG